MVDQPMTPRTMGDMDAPHESPVSPADDARTILLNKVSWGAVLAGVVAALVTQLIINMLGIGIGVATLDPGTGDNPAASTFSVAAAIWWTLSGIIASLVGGYMAGRLCGRPKESTAGWHGLTAWAMTTLVIFYLLTSTAGSLVGGVFNTIGSAIGGLGRAAGATAQTAAQAAAPSLSRVADPFGAIEQQVKDASGGNDPAALRDAAVSSMKAALTGDPAQAQQARDRAAQALSKSANISVDEARNRINQYEQQYKQAAAKAKEQAIEAARTTAKVVSRAALFGALGLILGALAAWYGGRAGAVDPTVTATRLRTTFGMGARRG